MNLDIKSLRAQLAPGWSTVNIILLALAFLFYWPVGLAMLAYILKGADFGLDLGRPGSYMPFLRKVGDSARAVVNKFSSRQTPVHSTDGRIGGTPSAENSAKQAERQSFEDWRDAETKKLKTERADLEKDKAQFEEKRSAVKDRLDA